MYSTVQANFLTRFVSKYNENIRVLEIGRDKIGYYISCRSALYRKSDGNLDPQEPKDFKEQLPHSVQINLKSAFI